jgi:hypothetical protein
MNSRALIKAGAACPKKALSSVHGQKLLGRGGGGVMRVLQSNVNNIYCSPQPAAPHLKLKLCLAAGQPGTCDFQFSQKNYYAEYKRRRKRQLFCLNSACFVEQKTLGIPFCFISRKKKMSIISFRETEMIIHLFCKTEIKKILCFANFLNPSPPPPTSICTLKEIQIQRQSLYLPHREKKS